MIALLISNTIQVRPDSCGTVEIQYRNEFDAFGMVYENDSNFYNQNRIGAYFRNTKRAVTEKVYRPTNGVFRSANVTIDKLKDLVTELIDEDTCDALEVALKHSEVLINDTQYFHQGVMDIEEDEMWDLYYAKATLNVQGFNQTNFSC